MGDMYKSVYDADEDGVIELPQLDPALVISEPPAGFTKVTDIYLKEEDGELVLIT